jgi:TolB-like protein
MKKILFIFSIWLVPALCYSQESGNIPKSLNIAVTEFDARGVSQVESLTISDFFRTALVNIGTLNVLDRNNMDKILAEQKFQMSGCTREECAVQMGKLLNVDRIITGVVTNFAPFYYISVSVINVETGEIIHSEKIRCNTRDDLPDKSEELAKTISERLTGKKPLLRIVPEREILGINIVILNQFIDLSNPNYPGSKVTVTKLALPPSNLGIGFTYYPFNDYCVDLYFFPAIISKSSGIQIPSYTYSIDYEQSSIFLLDINKEFAFSKGSKWFIGYGMLNFSNKVSVKFFYESFSEIINIHFLTTGLKWKIKERLRVSLFSNYYLFGLPDDPQISGFGSSIGVNNLKLYSYRFNNTNINFAATLYF